MRGYEFSLSSRELTGLFLFLRKREDELDQHLEALLERMSGILYEELSIDEMETLEQLYLQKIDVLGQKG